MKKEKSGNIYKGTGWFRWLEEFWRFSTKFFWEFSFRRCRYSVRKRFKDDQPPARNLFFPILARWGISVSIFIWSYQRQNARQNNKCHQTFKTIWKHDFKIECLDQRVDVIHASLQRTSQQHLLIHLRRKSSISPIHCLRSGFWGAQKRIGCFCC